VIAQAEGEAKRFLAVYAQYRNAPEVTRRRIYLETMSSILSPMNKIILDEGAGRSVVPYLPLEGFDKRTPDVSVTEPVPPSNAPQVANPPAQGSSPQ